MTDELFQTAEKIKARSPLNAYQQGVYAVLWIALWAGAVFGDFHPHHRPVSSVGEIGDFVVWPALCLAHVVVYLKLRSKERAA